jgi:hypothetical protein
MDIEGLVAAIYGNITDIESVINRLLITSRQKRNAEPKKCSIKNFCAIAHKKIHPFALHPALSDAHRPTRSPNPRWVPPLPHPHVLSETG